jgi:hypothetical protein
MKMVEEEFTSEPIYAGKPKQSAMDDLDELEDFVNDVDVVGGKKKTKAQAVSNVRKQKKKDPVLVKEKKEVVVEVLPIVEVSKP